MKKLIIIALITSLVGFWGCESTAVEPQVNETDILLSKIQNASLDEIHQFFGTTNSEGISIRKDASYLKLVFPNKSLNTDDLIIIVEDEYLDNIEEAPRALFVNIQTYEVITALAKENVEGKDWTFVLSQDELIETSIDMSNNILTISTVDNFSKRKNRSCFEECFIGKLQAMEDAWDDRSWFGNLVYGVIGVVTAGILAEMLIAAVDCLAQCA